MASPFFALCAALVVAALSSPVLYHLYSTGRLTIDVSDGQGHGPDHGSPEWKNAILGQSPSRAAFGSLALGVVTFTAITLASRSRWKKN